MKTIRIRGKKETPQQYAERRDRVDALIRANIQKNDFEIGLLCSPSLSADAIRVRRLQLGIHRPRTHFWEKVPKEAAV